ncbi:MAG: dTMP kinase [Burkholderiales bacterium]|nr:dTMP kinase [Burkholderiales bacterium]
MTPGKFITLEGLDGAGKSSHAEWLLDHLRAGGRDVKLTREPGGTALGEKLRELLLGRSMHLTTEVLLMFAARNQHLHELIWPALTAGTWIVSDRFTDASYAYQGGGGGLVLEKIEALERWVHPGFEPDLTLLFDLPPEIARARTSKARAADRFEQKTVEYFQRVRAVYLQRAAASAGRIRVIDAAQAPDLVRQQIEEEIGNL